MTIFLDEPTHCAGQAKTGLQALAPETAPIKPPNGPHFLWLSAVTWDFPLGGRTRMLAEAWRAADRPTAFVQIPSYRTALERIAQPFRSKPSLPVVRPWPSYPATTWPLIGETRLRRSIGRRARALRRQLERHIDLDDAVALVVSPAWTPWLDELPFRAVIYDCIDDLAVMTPRPALQSLYQKWEAELIGRANAAIASADPLAAAISSRRPDLPVTTIRNGADVSEIRRRAASANRPLDLPARGSSPLVGFVGALYDWIDWHLIRAVAERLPAAEFVFIGPLGDATQARTVADSRNVHLLGYRSYDKIPAYMAAFEVCWVPFRQGSTALHANPVKIYEYLSLGKPVVSTPIADTHSFEGFVSVGKTPEEIANLLTNALVHSRSQAQDRVRFAHRNAWLGRATSYIQFVESIVPPP